MSENPFLSIRQSSSFISWFLFICENIFISNNFLHSKTSLHRSSRVQKLSSSAGILYLLRLYPLPKISWREAVVKDGHVDAADEGHGFPAGADVPVLHDATPVDGKALGVAGVVQVVGRLGDSLSPVWSSATSVFWIKLFSWFTSWISKSMYKGLLLYWSIRNSYEYSNS